MKFRGLCFVERIGPAPRIDASVPHGLARIDVANSGDARLVEQEFFDWTPGSGEEFGKARGSEFFGEGVDAESLQTRTLLARLEKVNPPEMAPIGKSEHATIEFERDVDVDVMGPDVRFGHELLRRRKPEKPPVEAKVENKNASREFKD